mmetsp:Transcript_34390/g.105355  ORF Transcript_34390/g.105355 Transcript_34390/m.105355 type:complete len:343 (-) Transcript_34390:870-1898(-)
MGTARCASLESGSSTAVSSSAFPGPEPASCTHAAPHPRLSGRNAISRTPPAAAAACAPRLSAATASMSKSDRWPNSSADGAPPASAASSAASSPTNSRTSVAPGACARCLYSNSLRSARSTASSLPAVAASTSRPLTTIAGAAETPSERQSAAWCGATTVFTPAMRFAVSAAEKASGTALASSSGVRASPASAAACSRASSRRAAPKSCVVWSSFSHAAKPTRERCAASSFRRCSIGGQACPCSGVHSPPAGPRPSCSRPSRTRPPGAASAASTAAAARATCDGWERSSTSSLETGCSSCSRSPPPSPPSPPSPSPPAASASSSAGRASKRGRTGTKSSLGW